MVIITDTDYPRCMSVYLCCLDVTYCLRCLVYWSPGHPPPASAASDSPPLGSLWERTMWRYWRCYTALEDADPVFDHGKGPFINCVLFCPSLTLLQLIN